MSEALGQVTRRIDAPGARRPVKVVNEYRNRTFDEGRNMDHPSGNPVTDRPDENPMSGHAAEKVVLVAYDR